MRALAIVTLAALAQARPEYSSGGGGYSSGGGGYSSGGGGYSSGGGGYSSGGGGYSLGSGGYSSGGGGYSLGSGGYSSGGGGYSLGGGGGGGGGGGYSNNAAPLVTKHVYVHVAPQEPDVQRQVRIQAPGQPKKHYKIVFIKAPAAPAPAGASIQLPQQDEEKTLIYVLHKKEEQQAEINIQPAAPATPQKPEVYFIKYRTQKGGAPSTSYGAPSASYGAQGGSY